MKNYLRSLPALLALLLAAASLPAIRAQEAEPDDEDTTGFGDIIIEIGAWVAQPAGLQYFSATAIDPTNPVKTQILGPDYGTSTDFRYRLGFEFPNNIGTLIGTWYSQSQDDVGIRQIEPGNFRFGELQAHPLFAGFENDGLADGFDSTTSTSLSDLRIDFQRTAFDTARVRGTWFVGLRRVNHDRDMTTEYYAVDAPLPAFLPPVFSPQPQIEPLDDSAESSSSYTGRGLSAGMEFDVPLWKDRIAMEASFSVSALRGKTSVSYRSKTNYYVLSLPEGETIVHPPYDEFEELVPNDENILVPLVNDISQRTLDLGLTKDSISTSSSVIDLYLGFRFRVWKKLDLLVGFRDTQYDDVGLDARPVVVTSPGGPAIEDGEIRGVNLVNLTETSHSATYEGYYFGLRVAF